MVRIVLPAASLTGSDAGARRLAVEMDGAGAAEPRAAAEFRPGHAQFVAQRPQQRHFRLDVDGDFPPVDKKIDHRPGASICCSELITKERHDWSASTAGGRSNWREANDSAGEYRDCEEIDACDLTARASDPILSDIGNERVPTPLTIACPPACGKPGARLADGRPVPHPLRAGPAGIVRIKREGDKGTPAGRFRLLWGYYRPDRVRLRAAGAPLKALRRDQGWCEDPSSPRYNRPVRLPARDCTDRMWREDHLYDLTFVLDQNFSRRAKGRGSAIFFHLARARPHADRRLRRDFRRRHEETGAAPRARRSHGDRVAVPPQSADQNRIDAGRLAFL